MVRRKQVISSRHASLPSLFLIKELKDRMCTIQDAAGRGEEVLDLEEDERKLLCRHRPIAA